MSRFNFNTVKDFDNHINNSISGYSLLHSLIKNIATFFAKPNSVFVDLGCTTGSLIHSLSKELDIDGYGYDITDKQFTEGSAKLIKQDITAEDFTIPQCRLLLSVFTLQFIDVSDRPLILEKARNALKTDGAIILCEKELSELSLIQELYTFSNYDYKAGNFTEAKILEKERQLRGTMSILTAKENAKMIRKAGFVQSCFFKSLNFTGYILVKR